MLEYSKVHSGFNLSVDVTWSAEYFQKFLFLYPISIIWSAVLFVTSCNHNFIMVLFLFFFLSFGQLFLLR